MSAPKKKSKRRLRVSLAIMLGLFFACLLGGGAWYYARGDLREALQRVQDAELASSTEDLHLSKSPAERCQAFEQLVLLQKQVKDLRSVHWTSRSGQVIHLGMGDNHMPVVDFAPGLNPRPELLEYHASLGPTPVAELLALLPALQPPAIRLHDQLRIAQRLTEGGPWRGLARYLEERYLISPPEQLGMEAQRLINVARCIDGQIAVSMLRVKSEIICDLVLALCARVPALRDCPEHAEIISGLRSLAAELADDQQASYPNDLAMVCDVVQDHELLCSAMASSNIGQPPDALTWRLSRAQAIDDMLEVVQFMQSTPNAHRIRQMVAQRQERSATLGFLGQRTHALAVAAPYFSDAVTAFEPLHARLACLILAARLEGTPLPNDLFADSPNQSLKRIEVLGKELGCYSVGEDGQDDKGNRRRDLVFEWAAAPVDDAPAGQR